MNKEKIQRLRNFGFVDEANRIEMGLCPICKKEVKQEDFKDELSKKEFELSGLCQSCQDSIFIKL